MCHCVTCYCRYTTGEEHTVSAIKAFDSLSRKLRSLDDLPLKIAAVQPTSDVNRHTRVFPPRALSVAPRGQVCWTLVRKQNMCRVHWSLCAESCTWILVLCSFCKFFIIQWLFLFFFFFSVQYRWCLAFLGYWFQTYIESPSQLRCSLIFCAIC